MGDSTRTTDELWGEIAARLAHPSNDDPLGRHLLCRATGLHDDDGTGRCRDCLGELAAGDEVADTQRRWVW